MADEARFCARRAARPAGGSVQGQERGELGWQNLEAPGGALGSRERERERQRGQPPARAALRLHVEHVGRALVVPVPEAGVAWAL